ncbi:hypothetical protein OKA06_06860 [Novosphingobium sp. MW5]|nr:hypothetical protein [Novosphingobium sp. MW5]
MAVITSLGACSRHSTESDPAAETSAESAAVGTPSAASSGAGQATTPGAGGQILTLEGLSTLKLGQPVPDASSWSERGAQASDTCRIITSPDYPGVYAIAEQGKVRRITAGEGATARTIEGIGPGSTRKQVDEAFPGLRESPHKYISGGKYLTAPVSSRDDPAVRLELSPSGKVTVLHVGMMPQLGYVEGCS